MARRHFVWYRNLCMHIVEFLLTPSSCDFLTSCQSCSLDYFCFFFCTESPKVGWLLDNDAWPGDVLKPVFVEDCACSYVRTIVQQYPSR